MMDTMMNMMNNFDSSTYNPSWMEPAAGTIFYIVVCKLLKAREGGPIDSLALAVVHNCILIALSVVMAIGASHALYERARDEGFLGVFCSGAVRAEHHILDGAAGFWLKVYYLSKYYELGDTFLLCMKKKTTIPLHLYHHVIMLWITWAFCRYDVFEGSLWCVIVNSIIHTFMYVYYLLAALGQRVWWKKFLTAGQIVQFFTGFFYVNIYLYLAITREDGCGRMERQYVVWFMHAVNISFIVLFAQFFVQSYQAKPKAGENVRDKKEEGKKEQ